MGKCEISQLSSGLGDPRRSSVRAAPGRGARCLPARPEYCARPGRGRLCAVTMRRQDFWLGLARTHVRTSRWKAARAQSARAKLAGGRSRRAVAFADVCADAGSWAKAWDERGPLTNRKVGLVRLDSTARSGVGQLTSGRSVSKSQWWRMGESVGAGPCQSGGDQRIELFSTVAAAVGTGGVIDLSIVIRALPALVQPDDAG